MSEELPVPEKAKLVECDVPSAKRAGALAAYGCSDQEICDTLMLEPEQLTVAKTMVEYREQFSETAAERMKQQIDISTGWDGVENQAVAKVFAALKHSENPNYALAAARIANQAKRRIGTGQPRTIDPSKATQVVSITLNAGFVTRQQNSPIDIDITPKSIERKRVDMPNSKQVTDLLAPARPLLERMRERSIETMMTDLNFGEIKPRDG
jgi:predicted amidohydrolase